MLPEIDDLANYAMFLDFDGTLADIADYPDAARIDPSTLRNVEKIQSGVDQALAVVSGREIAAIDDMVAPLKLPVVGVHGLERRDSLGRVHKAVTDPEAFAELENAVRRAVGHEPGLIVEPKYGAISLHFRLRPELEAECREIMECVTRDRPDLAMLRGKMVFEAKLTGFDKGTGIKAFLDEPPFRGRTPIFAGDDVTDEAGFAVVNAVEGVSIKIGPEASSARYRAANIKEFQDWLERLASGLPREKER